MPALTDKLIRVAERPTKGRRVLFDTHRAAPHGFGIRITAGGRKAFVLRYLTDAGKDRLLTIGDYGTWTVTAARKQATLYRREIDSGNDILERRREERAELTLANVTERYCRARVDGLATAKSVRAMLSRHVLPTLGRKKISALRRRDVIALLEDLAAKHPRQAGKVLAYVKQIFAYAEDREIIDGNPVATLKATKVGQGLTARQRSRVLDSDEIRGLWATDAGMHRLTALCLRLVLVTGQRPGEVAGMRWSEVDGDVWTIPAERRGKTKSAHTVPLTLTATYFLEQARAEVERLSARRGAEPSDFIFETRPGSAPAVNALDRAVKRSAQALGNNEDETWGHWTPHDLRRTCRTGLAALRVPETVAEAVIGHTRKGIAAVYDRHRYDHEKRAALEAWQDRLLWIVDDRPHAGNVVPIHTGAS